MFTTFCMHGLHVIINKLLIINLVKQMEAFLNPCTTWLIPIYLSLYATVFAQERHFWKWNSLPDMNANLKRGQKWQQKYNEFDVVAKLSLE
jgi:hypothetical protein